MKLSEAKELGFTHYGLYAGCVPIYYNANDIGLGVRWWVPEFLLDAAEVIVGLINDVKSRNNPGHIWSAPIVLTGELNP